jgi:hypothetical protein
VPSRPLMFCSTNRLRPLRSISSFA